VVNKFENEFKVQLQFFFYQNYSQQNAEHEKLICFKKIKHLQKYSVKSFNACMYISEHYFLTAKKPITVVAAHC
jgi:hypothetical protein